jgi:hypothetical protein
MYNVVSLKSNIIITLTLPSDWLEVGEVGKVDEVGKVR